MKLKTKIAKLLDREFRVLLDLESQGRYLTNSNALERDLVEILLKVRELKD